MTVPHVEFYDPANNVRWRVTPGEIPFVQIKQPVTSGGAPIWRVFPATHHSQPVIDRLQELAIMNMSAEGIG